MSVVDAPADEVFESGDARLLKRSRPWEIASFVPWGLGVGFIVAALATRTPALFAPLFHLATFGALAFFGVRKWNPSATWTSGRISAGPDGVQFDGKVVAPRTRIKEALVMPYKGQTAVRISLKGVLAPTYVAVKDVEEGRRLLRALGFDASQAVARLRAASAVFQWPSWKTFLLVIAPIITFAFGLGAIVSAFGKTAAPFAVALLPMFMAFVAGAMINPTKVDVGADGILTQWFGKKRWFSYADLEFVGPYEDARMGKVYIGVELGLRSGERVRLATGQKRWGDENQALILERISEAIETYKSGMSVADASILARNGRAPTDWITALRRVGAGANADMRTAAVPLERLWKLVEDASATAASRVGAAIALSPHIDARERKRIRVAAESTASPKLRVALEKASAPEATDEELAEVLATVEDAAEDRAVKA